MEQSTKKIKFKRIMQDHWTRHESKFDEEIEKALNDNWQIVGTCYQPRETQSVMVISLTKTVTGA